MPLQGDIAIVEEGQVPDQPLGGDISVTTSGEDRKLFMECSIAGISFCINNIKIILLINDLRRFSSFFVFLLFNVVERQYKRNGKDMDENNVPEMRPTFEEIRKVDDNGKEYWSSRELCNTMGYSGYWKFQNVIDKAIKVASEKVWI